MPPDPDEAARRRAQLVAVAYVLAVSFASTYAADPVIRRNTNAAIARTIARARRVFVVDTPTPTPPEVSALLAEARRITEEAARDA